MSERYECFCTVTRRLAEQFWATVLRLFVTDCLVNILLRAPDFGGFGLLLRIRSRFVSVQFLLHRPHLLQRPEQ